MGNLKLALPFALGLALLACSCGDGTGACGTPSGGYSDVETMSSSSSQICSLPIGGGTNGEQLVTITGAGPGYLVALPNIQGACPATSNGCSLHVQCTINVSDSSGTPTGSEKLNADWTFTTTGFSGQSTVVLDRSDGTSCTESFVDTGTRK
jgi:hypothetical protein